MKEAERVLTSNKRGGIFFAFQEKHLEYEHEVENNED